MSFIFNNGDIVKDRISGLTGIIRSSASYLTGCDRYAVQNKELKDGKPSDWVWFDESELIKTKAKPIELGEILPNKKGGPLNKNHYAP